MTNELLKQIGHSMVDDPENGYKEWETQEFTSSWYTSPNWEYLIKVAAENPEDIRRKLKTITYTVTRPEPYRGPMEIDQYFFRASPWMRDFYFEDFWCGTESDLRVMERGLVYLTPEDAAQAAKAMAGVGNE